MSSRLRSYLKKRRVGGRELGREKRVVVVREMKKHVQQALCYLAALSGHLLQSSCVYESTAYLTLQRLS